jgi:hypothetical protein
MREAAGESGLVCVRALARAAMPQRSAQLEIKQSDFVGDSESESQRGAFKPFSSSCGQLPVDFSSPRKENTSH